MKKRVVSAFILTCALSLSLDYTAEQAKQYTIDLYASDSLTSGAASLAAIDVDAIEASLEGSEVSSTAASLGAIYGYNNIGICTVEEGNLNIRAEASTDGKLIGKLPRNAACEIISVDGDWAYISSGKVEGYVNAAYLLSGDEAWEKASELAQLVATSTTGGLNIREEASTDSAVLAQMADGEEVTVIEELGDWVKVDVDGEEGYVFAEYVDVDLSLNTAMTLAEARYGAEVSQVRVELCDYALQFVGNPYVWGGTSLTHGADCSGFVLSIYAKYGIYLDHSSRAQANSGTSISASELQPGDLIFYGKGKYINHVAIYIGGGQIVHASNRREGIKVSNAFYRTPIKCVRLISD